jgi:hypothetical protein
MQGVATDMAFTVRQVDQPADRRREFWTWCFQNGFLATQVAGPVVVDPDQGTVTVTHWLPVDQPGDPDFPELRRDEAGHLLVETTVSPLLVAPPVWLVADASPGLAA